MMKSLSTKMRRVALIFLVALGASSAALACNVPVFRYALEHWRSDPYRVVLFHRGKLTDAERAIIRPLEAQQDQSLANFKFRTVDVDAADNGVDRELLAALGEQSLPLLVVQYPEHLRIEPPVWTGPPTEDAVARLIDSPARKELVKRLADGQTAVWLLLESGQAEKDDAAFATLQTQLKTLEKDLKLPELTDSPEDELLTAAPLQIAFSIVRIKHDDAAEQPLVQMLIHSEPDLAERSDAMIFPVFGRGRALFPLIGAGITAENIHDSAAFLVGPCSCQVKELNPGFDLLLSAEWETLLSQGGVPLASLSPSESTTPVSAELIPIPSGAPPAAAGPPATGGAPTPVYTVVNEWPAQSQPARGAIFSKRVILLGVVLFGAVFIVVVVVAIGSRGSSRSE